MFTAAFYKLMKFLPFVFIHYIFIVDKHFEISQLLKENSVKLSTSIPHVSSYKKTMYSVWCWLLQNQDSKKVLSGSPRQVDRGL